MIFFHLIFFIWLGLTSSLVKMHKNNDQNSKKFDPRIKMRKQVNQVLATIAKNVETHLDSKVDFTDLKVKKIMQEKERNKNT
jgi:hypothetical protein